MTTGTKLHQALAMLETAAGQFHTFTMDTDDAQAKQLYWGFSQQLTQMANDLRNRVQHVETQQPQYRVDNMIQSAVQKQQALQQQQMRRE